MGILTVFVGTASVVLLYGLAWILKKEAPIVRNRTAVEVIEIIALVLALFAGTEFVATGLGQTVIGWLRDGFGLIPVASDIALVIMFLVTISVTFSVVKGILPKRGGGGMSSGPGGGGKVGLGKAFFLPVLLGSFAVGTLPAALYAILTGPADAVTSAIVSHI